MALARSRQPRAALRPSRRCPRASPYRPGGAARSRLSARAAYAARLFVRSSSPRHYPPRPVRAARGRRAGRAARGLCSLALFVARLRRISAQRGASSHAPAACAAVALLSARRTPTRRPQQTSRGAQGRAPAPGRAGPGAGGGGGFPAGAFRRDRRYPPERRYSRRGALHAPPRIRAAPPPERLK